MKLGIIDEYSGLSSPLHRWEPRCKLISFIVLIFAFSFVRNLSVLLAMAAVTAAIYLISRLPASFLLRRLRYPSLFLLVVVLVLPFISGQTVVMSLGPVNLYQEGIMAVFIIAIRFLSILTIGLVLFGTTPFLTTIKAMRSLGLPAIMADMVLLSFRYLHEIGDDLQRMQTSMKLRGFHRERFSLRGLRIPAWLGGSLLVHSYERSEWVYKAMILRGYGQASYTSVALPVHGRDLATLGFFILVAAGFVIGDILYGHSAIALIQ
jgi:cobalt/nickel transport system permease protein